MSQNCMHCRWWALKQRTEAAVYAQDECRKRAPHPAPDINGVPQRAFPITRGEDGCGDYQPATRDLYREDYAETMGPWISTEALFGPRPGWHRPWRSSDGEPFV